MFFALCNRIPGVNCAGSTDTASVASILSGSGCKFDTFFARSSNLPNTSGPNANRAAYAYTKQSSASLRSRVAFQLPIRRDPLYSYTFFSAVS